MENYLKRAFICLFCVLLFNGARAQQKDTINVGTITGLLRDSVHNYVLPSATMAVYKVKDNELVSYQLTNTFGKYQFKNVPVGMPLRMVVTHVGYQSVKRDFEISPKTKAIELNTINLHRFDLSLKEVVISAAEAPMQMHGDTLEFNASAFKMDSTAVVGDLLRKLPGVTVWADGAITVNGKKINRLLVDGKDFFGGNNKIALDNIPKDAVQKIQVYQNKDDKNPVNPKTDMNIVLKKEKKDGFFGKFGAGVGTHGHYAGDGMIAYFSPKTQVNVVGADNNVNKTADDVNTLTYFNSFKGEGINSDYHSDFTKPGVNVFKAGGATISQDFSKDSDPRQPYFKTNLLKGEIFTSDAVNNTITNSQNTIGLGAAGTQIQTSTQTSNSNNFNLRSNADYEKRSEYWYLHATAFANDAHSTSQNAQKTITSNDQTADASQDVENQNSNKSSISAGGTLDATTRRHYDLSSRTQRSINGEYNYSYNIDNGTDDSKNMVNFNATDATQDHYVNRQYLKDWNGWTQKLIATFKDLIPFVDKSARFLQLSLSNDISLNNKNEHDNVGDLAIGATNYTTNTSLTNVTHYKTIDEKPSILISKDFSKYLDNRYYKAWSVTLIGQEQFYSQKNEALQAIQNIDRYYNYFLPHVEISRLNDQYGDFNENYSLSYTTSVTYPGIDQLAPLYDDANIYTKTIGNLSLRPAYKHSLDFHYNYYDQTKKNPLNYYLWIAGGLVKHNIADSVLYDDLSRATHKFINTADSHTFNFNNTVEKAFNFKDHQFQLHGNTGVDYSAYTSNVNGEDYLSRATTLTGSGSLTYSYKSIWTAQAGEDFSGTKQNQGSLSHFTEYTWKTKAGFAFAFPHSFFLNTMLNFNNSKASSQNNNIYYTIWNADLGYRFLKGSRGEIKFSALDLLHQNKAIQNYIGPNQLSTSSTNVLQQYFMLTLAYYPRSFGLHGKKK